MTKVQLIHACQSVIRQLLILTDKGYYLSSDRFFADCEGKDFILSLKKRFAEEPLGFLYLDRTAGSYNSKISEFFEDAMARYAKTVSMEELGLRSNALLMGIHLVMFIMEEANEMPDS